jgi:D-amino-acid oxidase
VQAVLRDHPSTTLLVNCTGLGSLFLEDIKDTNLYPTRGQTLLIAEPELPVGRMYEAQFMYSLYSLFLFITCTYFLIIWMGGKRKRAVLICEGIGISAPPRA